MSMLNAQCPGGSGVVGGTVTGDYNYNGVDDQVGGVRNVTVNLYDCGANGESVLLQTTTTDFQGDYFFTGLNDTEEYRVEFETPDGMVPGFGGGDFASGLQFATAPDCNINTSFAIPDEFHEPDPYMITTCFINGDPLAAGSESGDLEVIVGFPFSSSGQTSPPEKLGEGKDYGSIYGLAYNRNNDLLFTSSFLKRHVGVGPEGLGGIYVTDLSANPASKILSFDMTNLGANVGTIPSNSARGLTANVNGPSNDADAFDKVGKVGFGAMDMDRSGQHIYVTNLFDKKLHRINVSSVPAAAPTAGDVTTYDLSTISCTGGEYRPFAVKVHRGSVYVGGVCDASVSQQASDLKAYVHRLDGTSFTQIASFDLDYDKGYTTRHADCENFPGWYPWVSTLPAACDNGATIVYPQPILSDLEFDVDGSLILGFMDRFGHQLGNRNYPLTGNAPLISTVSGGDLLRANLNDDGTYTLESNGTAGPYSTGGAGNGEGPGGGEFYYRDVFEGGLNNVVPAPHAETSQGGIAFYRGSGLIATTALDPYSTAYNTGGVNWFNSTNSGIRDDLGYQLYRTSTSNITSFAKANGLGDLIITSAIPPIQIGGMAWVDQNSDGVQDGCEMVLPGIDVSIFDENGNIITTTTTDANGEYYFDSNQIDPNTKYFIAFGTGGQYNSSTRQLNGAYYYTNPNTGSTDSEDSDITIGTAAMGGGAVTGLPFIMVMTGDNGEVNHTYDAGFTPEDLFPVAGIGDYVWIDSNGDGIQTPGEQGIGGVVVNLIDDSGMIVATTMTNPDGSYFFPNVQPGTYCVEFVIPAGYEGTTQNSGNGSNDSDINPMTGKTNNFNFDPSNGDNLMIDAGLIVKGGTIQGIVFKDCNDNGIYDANESTIPNVAVQLVGGSQQVMTDAAGVYLFPGVAPGTYNLQFSLPANAGLLFVAKDQGGDDNADSDVEPDGSTDDFTISADELINNIFAGAKDIEAPVLTGVPGDVTVDFTLGQTVPPVSTGIAATDNCDTDVTIAFNEDNQMAACGFVITRTWTATDDCGNSTVESQVITVDEGCVCPNSDIIDADITPSCGAVGGTATINVNGPIDDYDFLWIPNRGSVGATANSRVDLPIGTYLVIMQHPSLSDCNDKIYVTIEEDCSFFPTTIVVELKRGESIEFCHPAESLSGNIVSNQITCLSGCPLADNASLGVSECVLLTANNAIGTQMLSYEACDEFGTCETVILNVQIQNTFASASPIAERDYIQTAQNERVTFDVGSNDTFNGDLSSLDVITKPEQGRIQVNRDLTFTYVPKRTFCGEDYFHYQICNDMGCDVTTVSIKVDCSDMVVVSGFSPNNDGINDYFTVSGIQQYENKVTVFNRWGNVVFEKENYENDWQGTYNGAGLPSGVYYYVINYNGEKMTGYVVIRP